MLQEDYFNGEMNIDKAVDQTATSTSAGKYTARGKTKKLTPEQLAARRRRLWVMIMKKEIPRVSQLLPMCTVGHNKGTLFIIATTHNFSHIYTIGNLQQEDIWFAHYKLYNLLEIWKVGYVIVRPLSTVGYTSIASVIHSRQWSNYLNS